MRLSRQLMAVSLLMLGLPWAGCQYLRELEGALRQGQEQALTASARAIAASFTDNTQLSYSASPPAGDRRPPSQPERQPEPLYAEAVNWPVIVDGYDNEWQSLPSRRFTHAEAYPVSLQLRAAIKERDLYLYFQIHDDQVRYQNPAHSVFENGDRLVLHTGAGRRYVLLTGAPGDLPAYRRQGEDYVLEQAIEARWQDHRQGYSIELSIPLRLLQGRLGFVLLDENNQGVVRARLGNMPMPGDNSATRSTAPALVPTLINRSPQLEDRLQRFKEPGLRLQLINGDRWRIAATGTLYHPEHDRGHWLLRWLYRTILQEDHAPYPAAARLPGRENRLDVEQALQGQPSVRWYRAPDDERRSVLAVAMPVIAAGSVRAVLLAEESNERFLGLTDRAFQRLLIFGVIAFLLTGVGLVSYAAWLSWRIRRLSRATSTMIDSENLRLDRFPNSRAQDEIGDLTRSFRRLFGRIRQYTEYLQSLSRKLTHELRTPLAVVRTSLDNLGDENLTTDSRIYLQRARDGAERLSLLLTALSEATRVEEAIQQSEQEPINLAALLEELITVYRQLHPGKRIELSGILPMHRVSSRTTIMAAPELLAQMFDKLIANAVDFTPDGGEIHFHYQENSRHIMVDVSNDGPLLPAKIRHQIFDQLVSARTKKDNSETVHLGLGLYIVRLVVEYHQGHIRAENRPDKRGVVFSVNLPLIDRKPTASQPHRPTHRTAQQSGRASRPGKKNRGAASHAGKPAAKPTDQPKSKRRRNNSTADG